MLLAMSIDAPRWRFKAQPPNPFIRFFNPLAEAAQPFASFVYPLLRIR
jgi:hypothetical protein